MADDRVLLLPMEGLLDRLTEALGYPNSTTIDRTIARADAQRAISLLGGDNLDLPTRGGLLDITADLERAANFAEHDGGEVDERLAHMLATAGRIKKALG